MSFKAKAEHVVLKAVKPRPRLGLKPSMRGPGIKFKSLLTSFGLKFEFDRQ